MFTTPTETLAVPSLALSMGTLYEDPAATASSDAQAENAENAETPAQTASDGKPLPGYGRAGTDWLTFGAFYANDFDSDSDINLHVSWSRFLVDDIEFMVEGALWYFNQEGQDTGGLSGSFRFRWHFLAAQDYRWTVFADAGIGLLAGFDEVPDGGTGFNFIPRAGMGFTRAFNESIEGESHGPRWEVGFCWHHISNGRIEGDGRNPARDSLAIYAGIIIPF